MPQANLAAMIVTDAVADYLAASRSQADELLAEMGREDKLMPSQVLVKIVGEYLKIRLALWEIGQIGIRGKG